MVVWPGSGGVVGITLLFDTEERKYNNSKGK
jgi:hypothetical protein